jgi:hypothetical protein
MRRSLLLAAGIATLVLIADQASAAFRIPHSARDLDGWWRFDAIEAASVQSSGRASSNDVTVRLECRLNLRPVNQRRAVTTDAKCFDNQAGWQHSDFFMGDSVDFIVKSDGAMEIYLADDATFRGKFTRDRSAAKGKGDLTLDQLTSVVWTMARQ